MGLLQLLGIKSKGKKIDSALAEGAIIVDVRSPQEYKLGHVKGAMNIPLETIASRVEILKKKNKAIITCCQSGMRSAKAKSILEKNGLEVINGGGWMSLQNKIK